MSYCQITVLVDMALKFWFFLQAYRIYPKYLKNSKDLYLQSDHGLYYLPLITKTRLYNFDSLKPHFYIVKLGFTGVYIIFLNHIDCGYSLEPPSRGGSNEYPQSMFLSSNKKNNVYPCKPQFYYINVGFKGVKIL